MDTVEIKTMNTVELLQAMEMIWNSLLNDEVEDTSPGWHRGVIQERIAQIDSGGVNFFSLQEL